MAEIHLHVEEAAILYNPAGWKEDGEDLVVFQLE
jgi:hypothetical protein